MTEKIQLVKLFVSCAKNQEDFTGSKMSVRDIDMMMCGFITALTINKNATRNQLIKLSDLIIATSFAKTRGITGTDREMFKEVIIK